MWLRRIIRSFFLGLLLLCVGVWVGSYIEFICATYQGRDHWALYPVHGVLYLQQQKYTDFPKGFTVFHRALGPDERFGPFWGFTWVEYFLSTGQCFGAPLWFPTTLSALAVFVVWRKTAKPKPGRAFPVEMEKGHG